MCCLTVKDMVVEINLIANYAALKGHYILFHAGVSELPPHFVSKGYKEQPGVCVG